MSAMQKATLTPALSISRIGYGGSRLHYLRRPADRQNLLAAALDHGITHFDVAPLYGHGLAEREMGAFLKGRRDKVTVATKWGLATPSLGGRVPRALSFHAAALATVGRKLTGNPARPNLTPALLEHSVTGSLKRLGTDHIDLYLMHEPVLAHLPDPDAVRGTLGELVARGLIRAWGVAGYGSAISDVLGALGPDVPVVQADENDWPEDRTPDITFGVVSRIAQSRHQPTVAGDDAARRVAEALERRPEGAVLISTTKPQNLAALARLGS